MTFLQRVEFWGDHHHPKWLDLLRIALGIFLCYKGVQFMYNTGVLLDMMSRKMSFGQFTLVLIGHYIVAAHILGGVLLILGLLTRFACLIQIPILMGAIILVNASPTLMQPFSELMVSIVVLLLLVYFLIIGNGPWSFDAFAETEQK